MATKTLIGNVRGLKGDTGAAGAAGADGKDAIIDSVMSEVSTNALRNSVITKKFNSLDNEMTDVKKSVSDGKTLVASAITDKGVETASDATFEAMAENIANISTGGGGTLVNSAGIDTSIPGITLVNSAGMKTSVTYEMYFDDSSSSGNIGEVEIGGTT